ncbi:MAG: hypothetical protein KH268_00020 [Clostridiales bacterium]|nr:hypothetical protein [Clostridiales bacterium]
MATRKCRSTYKVLFVATRKCRSTPYNGSTSTGGCDGFWQNVDITAVARRFGDCGNGTNDGLRDVTAGGSATSADWSIGVAILLLPPVGVAA